MDQVTYLKSLPAVRDRAHQVLEKGIQGSLQCFNVDMSKLDDVVNFVADLIKRDYASPNDVPPHSRWRHFEMHGIQRIPKLLESWKSSRCDGVEQTRRLIDCFVVSVLLDAGAGNKWSYDEKETGHKYSRSEGLGIASLEMFKNGNFSSNSRNPHQVDSQALTNITVEEVSKCFQVSDNNPLVGLEGRTSLLKRLGDTIAKSHYFQPPANVKSPPRPGFLVDYIISHSTTSHSGNTYTVHLTTLWDVIMSGLSSIWPATRTTLNLVSLGDVWPCDALKTAADASESKHLVPFHKLSQWLTYSLMEPLEKVLNAKIVGKDLLTGLAEYRNGGLFVDFDVITLKPIHSTRGLSASNNPTESLPTFTVSDPVIIEWRALTVALLDKTGEKVRSKFGLSVDQLELAKVLEGGTWKAGREIAANKRPETKNPPIMIISDGTVF
ncbi:hypothetical protein BKA69DRAFT_1125725 [Paraphysoderma sedebokerense]|nr:hypothetical protein BKA69DRAFT_1125725 [Paraphysoderma sedebokerense]